MAHQFDAYTALRDLQARYADYLLELMRVRPGMLAERLLEHWRADGDDGYHLFGPLFVQPAFPFVPGASRDDLVARSGRTKERPLHPKTLALMAEAKLSDPLYSHQVEAIREAARGQTIVLSAGTGSGKTEAFLIPIIDDLHWAHEEGRDDLACPGVRAIVVYPLNALVNNQIERIQHLLRTQREITFGYYTSRLKESPAEAKRYYEDALGRPLPPSCQVIDRRTMRGASAPAVGRLPGPPHILVTNFSMLEYMLIRPLDRPIFEPQHIFHKGSPRLRGIVLDEAHVYGGSQATEIHMLLRRAALRFGTELERVQGYATSATLSQGDDERTSKAKLRQFAAEMFAKSEGQVAAIVATRHTPELGQTATSRVTLARPETLPPGHLVPLDLQTLDFDADGNAVQLRRDSEASRGVVEACATLGLVAPSDIERLAAAEDDRPASALFNLLRGNSQVRALRTWLFQRGADSPPTLDEVAARLYDAPPTEASRRATDAVLRLGSLARESHADHPMIPTRMHAMMRAPSGVWVRPLGDARSSPDWPWGDIQSTPPTGAEGEAPTVPLLVCESCGEPYLAVWRDRRNGFEYELAAVETRGAQPVLVARASGTRPEDGPWGATPGALVEAVGHESVQQCAHCRRQGAALRPLQLSPRQALGAVVDFVYPHLAVHPGSDAGANLPGEGRRLLTFSDSRQEAARAATSIEDTHDVGLNRQMLWRTMNAHGKPIAFSDLRTALARDNGGALRQRALLLDALGEPDDQAALVGDVATLSIFQELARLPADARTLETLGLVEVLYPGLPPRPTDAALGTLTREEWADLLRDVLDDMRRRGAVATVSLSTAGYAQQLDQALERTLGRWLVWATNLTEDVDEDGDEPTLTKVALVPQSQRASRVREHVRRIAEAVGCRSAALLDAVWKELLAVAGSSKGAVRWLKHSKINGLDGLQIDLERLEFVAREQPVFLEPLSGRPYFRSVRGLYPVVEAHAPLRAPTNDELTQWRHRHAVRRVQTAVAIPGLLAAEHTAQIGVDELERAERGFRRGERNLLACSTTMEMGVDLGGLTLVLMTNVPPTAANYWQRAGRTGRRADGSSLVLTLALGRPHDQKVFRDARGFFAQPMLPPKVRLDTAPLVSRHVQALLLATFLEFAVVAGDHGNPMASFGTVADFALDPPERLRVSEGARQHLEPGATVADAFCAWLHGLGDDERAGALLDKLRAGSELETWTRQEIATRTVAEVRRAIARVLADVEVLEAQRSVELARAEGLRDRSFLRWLEAKRESLRDQTLISYLARNDFLPRFGFPVDVVHLDTAFEPPHGGGHHGVGGRREAASPELRMERALAMALSEYAPGSEVIAAKRVHRVAGLVRNWLVEGEQVVSRRLFSHCARCGHLEISDVPIGKCPVCEHPCQNEIDFVRDERAAQRQRADHDHEFAADEPLGPSPVRHFFEPSSFAVQMGVRPRRLRGKLNRMPSALVELASAPDARFVVAVPGAVEIGFAARSTLFFRSEGKLVPPSMQRGYGFAICKVCGRAEPENGWRDPERPDQYLPKPLQGHKRLRGAGKCPGASEGIYWRHAVLGTSGLVDLLRLRLRGDLLPRGTDDFFLTLAVCMQEVVAELLQVDRRTLSPGVGSFRLGDATQREAFLYDASASGLLAHVLESPKEMLESLLRMLETREASAFVRFDNQFLAEQGRLKIGEVRDFFLAPGRREQLAVGEHARGDCRPVGGSFKVEALRILRGGAARLDLFAAEIAVDAFDRDGLLRYVQGRANWKQGPTRLLLANAPTPSARDPERVRLAQRLAELIESGVDVRVAPTGSVDALACSPLRLFAECAGRLTGLGMLSGLRAGATPSSAPAFGSEWLVDGLAVVGTTSGSVEASRTFEAAWTSARVLEPGTLRPAANAGVRYVPVREGSKERRRTHLVELLQDALGMALPMLGKVTRLLYSDRYLGKSLVALWQLERTLEAFDFATGASGVLRYLHVAFTNTRRRELNAEGLLNDRYAASGDLHPGEHKALLERMQRKVRDRGLKLELRPSVQYSDRVRHPRKLLLEFAPGSAVQSLKVDLEHGCDWARPLQSGSGPWTRREFCAEETHFVIVENHDMSLELDGDGRSDWASQFSPPT